MLHLIRFTLFLDTFQLISQYFEFLLILFSLFFKPLILRLNILDLLVAEFVLFFEGLKSQSQIIYLTLAFLVLLEQVLALDLFEFEILEIALIFDNTFICLHLFKLSQD